MRQSDQTGEKLLTFTYADLLRHAGEKLTSSPTAMLDARQLLCYVTGFSHSDLIANEKELAPSPMGDQLMALVTRRGRGEPIAYIVGHQEFYGRDFTVSPAVLIPRPETEMIIDASLQLSPAPRTILDLGTGSGCLLGTLLAELPNAVGVGLDISQDALAVAQQNVDRLGVAPRATLHEQDFRCSLAERFDIIVSNPPYIEAGAVLPPSVAHYEPPLALFAGEDGLEAYRQLAPVISQMLSAQGTAFLEIGTGQGAPVQALLKKAMPTRIIEISKDLAGHQRLVEVGPEHPL